MLSAEYEDYITPLAIIRPPTSNAEFHVWPQQNAQDGQPKPQELPNQLALYFAI